MFTYFEYTTLLKYVYNMNEFLFNPKSPNDIAKNLVEKIKQHRKLPKFRKNRLLQF